MSDLKSCLLASAGEWSRAHGGAPLSRLGKQVAGDASFFQRQAMAGASMNLGTLAKFATYLADPGNWPDGKVPADVRAFIHRVHGSGSASLASPDNGGGNIGQAAAA